MIGIVASRIAERHHRPVVLIALDGEPRAPARAARSRPSTCSAALDAGAEHLARHGGHRAAAGCTIARRRASTRSAPRSSAHAAAVLAPEDLVPVERVDAVVAGDELGARRWPRSSSALAPFGIGNPAVVAARPGRAARRPAADGGGQARALHRRGRRGARARGRVRHARALPAGAADGLDATFRARAQRVERAPSSRGSCCASALAPRAGADRRSSASPSDGVRAPRSAELDARRSSRRAAPAADRRRRGVAATAAAHGARRRRWPRVVATGEPVLVVVRRRARARRRPAAAASAASRSARWRRAASATRRSPTRFAHVVALDPPRDRRRAGASCDAASDDRPIWPGAQPELRFAQQMSMTEHAYDAALEPLCRRSTARCAAVPSSSARSRGDRAAGRAAAGCCASSTSSGSSSSTGTRGTRALVAGAPAHRAGALAGVPGATAAPTRRARRWLSQRDRDRRPERRRPRRRRRADGDARRRSTSPTAPVDVEHPTRAVAAPTSTPTERRLLADLFAIVEEHADEAAVADRPRARSSDAFVFACEHHADQRRKSGEDFIVHPVGVAKICAGHAPRHRDARARRCCTTPSRTRRASLDEVREQLRRRDRRRSSTASRSSPASPSSRATRRRPRTTAR